MSLADAVEQMRNERGWKQATLAEKSGFSQGMIANIENGERTKVEPKTLIGLARAFNISVDQLLTRAGYEVPSEIVDVYDQMRQMDMVTEDELAVLQFAEFLSNKRKRGGDQDVAVAPSNT